VEFANDVALDEHEQPEALTRVLNSLCAVAVQLTAVAGSMSLRVGDTRDELQIELDSIGATSAAERRELAKLYRVNRSVPPSAGFTPHAASAFATAHGGTLRVEYVEQLGVHLTLRLPRSRGTLERSAPRAVRHRA
jgi:K+-sensing histidine kinase KdpD